MNASGFFRSSQHHRTAPGRPPLLKVTRALVAAAIAQGQTRTALDLIANGFRTARSLPAAQQVELAIGVAEEAAAEVKAFVFSGLGAVRR